MMMEGVTLSSPLTPRQQREVDYHRDRASGLQDKRAERINFNVTTQYPNRRWFNAYWETYRMVRDLDLKGKRILVPGCGFGEDACRLAIMGAEVFAFDISPESAEIAQHRARGHKLEIDIKVMPAEKLDYPDRFFDAVFFLDVLHHVDIPKAMAEIRRVLKPGALIIGDELYTHSLAQSIRENVLIEKVLYPRMRRFIYGQDKPYITEDEHKIDEREFALVTEKMAMTRLRYFNLFSGRLVPQGLWFFDRLDRLILMLIGPLGKYVAGRLVFCGRLG